ncbi:hypothetical protein BD413DRAFT_531719 [Trametes elegans]|nr:hypothetical protein BD413DRAFT_531719 [Trametes elegans]
MPHVNSDSDSYSYSDSDSYSDSYSDSDSSSGFGSGGGNENDQMQVPASPFAEEQGMSSRARGQSVQAQATNSPQSPEVSNSQRLKVLPDPTHNRLSQGTETALDLASRYGGTRISLEWRVPAGGPPTEPVRYTFKRRLGTLGQPKADGNVFSVIWDDPAAFAKTQFMMYFTRETDASEECNPFVALGWRSDDHNSTGLLLLKKRQGYNAVEGLTDDEARRLGIGMDGLTMMNSYDARDA